MQLLQSTTVDHDTRRSAVESLVEIGTGNEIAIAALVQVLQSTTVNNYARRQAAESLGEIDPGNEIAIAALVQVLQSTTVNNYARWQAASILGKILQNNKHPFAVVQALSGYCLFYEDLLYQRQDYTGVYYNGEYYDLAWECAQNMPYPDFYQAWHQHNLVTRTMRSLAKILFTRII
ncbi:hypothetical protein NIES4072_41400 [Nostoc commune NIES-4072]|uniref:NACHT C-terminal Cysteine and Histidine-containing domain-containing protein n=1 Tax=Nostoc commune NIES-4072 TaxID=2005467 RepID=A0A2R5FX88_NOSCO|nr:hypothetical protein NIES4072_41400 [Nostoc commune NIES-4072]